MKLKKKELDDEKLISPLYFHLFKGRNNFQTRFTFSCVINWIISKASVAVVSPFTIFINLY